MCDANARRDSRSEPNPPDLCVACWFVCRMKSPTRCETTNTAKTSVQGTGGTYRLTRRRWARFVVQRPNLQRSLSTPDLAFADIHQVVIGPDSGRPRRVRDED